MPSLKESAAPDKLVRHILGSLKTPPDYELLIHRIKHQEMYDEFIVIAKKKNLVPHYIPGELMVHSKDYFFLLLLDAFYWPKFSLVTIGPAPDDMPETQHDVRSPGSIEAIEQVAEMVFSKWLSGVWTPTNTYRRRVKVFCRAAS